LALDDNGNLQDTPFALELRDYLATAGFRLVVIDPLSRFAGPEAEIDNAAATRFIQALEATVTASGATVLNAHHTNKLSRVRGGRVEAPSGRGSSALVDGARWQCSLAVERLKFDDAEAQERLGVVVTWDVTKSNYAAKPDPITLRQDPHNGGVLVPTDETDMRLIEQARQNATRSPKAVQREAERGQASAERSEAEADKRTERAARREESTRQRDAGDDKAARDLLNADPDAPVRVLVARLKAARACGSDRALDAIHRVRVPA
jgi:RecA-family ATPase